MSPYHLIKNLHCLPAPSTDLQDNTLDIKQSCADFGPPPTSLNFPCSSQLYSTMYCKYRSGHQRREFPADQNPAVLYLDFPAQDSYEWAFPTNTSFIAWPVKKNSAWRRQSSKPLANYTDPAKPQQRGTSRLKPKAHLTPAFQRESIHVQTYPNTYPIDSTVSAKSNPSQLSYAC
jgi:hypothetical protein